MKKYYVSMLMMLFIASMITTSVYSQAQKTDDLKAQIEKLNAKMVKAMHEDDHAALEAMYTDDVYYMPSYETMVKGKQKMIDREMKNKEAGFKMLDMKFDVVEVIPAGNMAIEIGKYKVKMEIPQIDGPINDEGKYVTVWERQKDGSLKIKVDTWNSDSNPMQMGHNMNDKDHRMPNSGREKMEDK